MSTLCRDLKPENILLNEDMHIQITDFGSAKILDKADDGNYIPGILCGIQKSITLPLVAQHTGAPHLAAVFFCPRYKC